MKLSKGYVGPKFSEHMCLLKKIIYYLKQFPIQCNIKFNGCMQSLNFNINNIDHYLYFKDSISISFFSLLNVNDIFIASSYTKFVNHAQTHLFVKKSILKLIYLSALI